jgi:uncharacterized protein (TIGR03382 family)
MRRIASLACVLGIAAVAHADPEPIIGGTATTLGEYPTVVGVVIRTGQGESLCTGELITKDWVVTAGHCVDPAPNGLNVANQAAVTAAITVVFNSLDVLGTGGTQIKASDTIMDPSFNIDNLGSHDMGLIKLVTPFTDTPPTPINLDAAKAPIGTVVVQVGYGTTSGTGNAGAGVEFELKNRTVVSCSSIPGAGFSSSDDANLLCFSQTDGKGKCEGDSGGPTFAMVNGVQTIIGTTSFGDQTCSAFGADTRTDAEKAFILANIPELAAPTCTVDADCKTADTICFQSACIDAPFSPMGLGTDCTSNTACQSMECGAGPGGMKCTTACTVGAANACPSGFDCLAAGSASTTGDCWPSGAGDGGCCDASGRSAPTSILALGFVALVLRRRRRR